MGLSTKLWKGTQWLGGVLLPFFSRAHFRGLANFLRWFLHFVMLAILLLGLGYLNHYFDLEKTLSSPWPVLHKYWLPLLFILFYGLTWLGYWLWRLVGPEVPGADFPELVEAWSEAVQALHQAGIRLGDAPLFLVLGRPAGGAACLFSAARIRLALEQTPRRADAPLHVFANRDAIFLCCTESSLLGHQATLFAAPEPAQRPLLTNKAVIDLLKARLQYLCRLIVQERRPYCPINGLILLVPLAATAGDAEASQVANLAQQDIHATRAVFQVDCPVFVLICDLEQAPGFRDFLEQVPEAQRHRPLGQRFPLIPDVDPQDISRILEGGIDWFCRHTLPASLHALFRLDSASESDGPFHGGLRVNTRLYQFLHYLRQGRKRLARIVHRGTQTELGASPMIAGCYLAATGLDPLREQAFVAGVFDEFLQNQNFVAWTPQALVQEAFYRRLTRLGYISLAVILLALGALGYFFLIKG